MRYLFTYIGFITLLAQVFLFFRAYENSDYISALAFTVTAAIISVLWKISNTKWIDVIEYYLLPFLHVSVVVYLIEILMHGFPDRMEAGWAGLVGIQLLFAWYLVMKRKWEHLILVPLLLGFIFFSVYAYTLALLAGTIVFAGFTVVMLSLSKRYFRGIIKQEETKIIVDFYRIFGFLYLLMLNSRMFINETDFPALEMVVSFTISIYLMIIRRFTEKENERNLYAAGAIVGMLYPYYTILGQFIIPSVLETEVVILPWFIISSILLRKVFDKGKTTQTIEMIVVAALFFLLIGDAMRGNTLDDALVIGTLSLVAIMIGFVMKYKSYFFTGMAAILLNIYLNTKSLWGNMPWWLYLIIGGILLITTASFLEYKKQKENTTSKDILERNKAKIKKWFEKWR